MANQIKWSLLRVKMCVNNLEYSALQQRMGIVRESEVDKQVSLKASDNRQIEEYKTNTALLLNCIYLSGLREGD